MAMKISVISEIMLSTIAFVVCQTFSSQESYGGSSRSDLQYSNEDHVQIFSSPMQQQHLQFEYNRLSNPTSTSSETVSTTAAQLQSFSTFGLNSVANGIRFQPLPNKPIITKSFFIHSAPDESDDDIHDEYIQSGLQPRKHYNILFIKTPSQTHRATALNFAQTLNEEKTVVYVLTKKTTATDLQNAIRDVPRKIQKPEVFFIKYRTSEEAENAQRQIQSQYDRLGGSSIISDDGISHDTSVVEALDGSSEQISSLEQQQQEIETTIGQNHDNVAEKSINGNQYFPPQY